MEHLENQTLISMNFYITIGVSFGIRLNVSETTVESIKRNRKDSSAVSTVWYICIYLRDISKATFIYLFSRLFIWFFSLHLFYYSIKLYKQFYSLSKFHYRIAVRFIGIRQSQASTRRALNIQRISNDPLYPINQNNSKEKR